MTEQHGEATYRNGCHIDGCGTRFIGISCQDYVEHVEKEHGELEAEIWARLVIDDA